MKQIKSLLGLTQPTQLGKSTPNRTESNSFSTQVNTSPSINVQERLVSSIPKNILNLLWFYDGPNKNLDTEDPSGISLSWPISTDEPDPLPYYPNYQKMTPGQRGTYINWLANISTPIDIGYVFVFFYGLERQIATGNIDSAVNVIAQLKKHHPQNSFNHYSDNALVFAALLKQDPNILRLINPETVDPINLVLSKGYLSHGLSATDIVHISKSIGWDNQRYIKLVPEKFITNLSSILISEYGKDVYPIPRNLSNIPIVQISLSNLTLNKEKYLHGPISISVDAPISINVPDFSNTPEIKTHLLMILKAAHNNTKIQLYRERRNDKHIKSTISSTKKSAQNVNVTTGWPMAKQSAIDREIINYKDMLHYAHTEKLEIYDTDSDEIKKMKLKNYEDHQRFDKFALPYHKGLIAYKRGEWEQAEELWISVIELNPSIIAEKLAIMLRKEKRLKDEIDIIKIGIQYLDKVDSNHETNNSMLTNRLLKAEIFYNNHKDQDESKGNFQELKS